MDGSYGRMLRGSEWAANNGTIYNELKNQAPVPGRRSGPKLGKPTSQS